MPSESDWRQILKDDPIRDALENLAWPQWSNATADHTPRLASWLAPIVEKALRESLDEMAELCTGVTVFDSVGDKCVAVFIAVLTEGQK